MESTLPQTDTHFQVEVVWQSMRWIVEILIEGQDHELQIMEAIIRKTHLLLAGMNGIHVITLHFAINVRQKILNIITVLEKNLISNVKQKKLICCLMILLNSGVPSRYVLMSFEYVTQFPAVFGKVLLDKL